ncbi:MAG: nuclear transport factor 2 family protein [Anaerolineaceae bacterium]|nr:nuclear transport factor 2 family protein [Anaerolineaceae bacterium]
MEDREEIRLRILDYLEGWYEGDAARMQRTLSPHLAKRRMVSQDEIWEVSKDWMVEATGEGKGKLAVPEKGRKEITILDQTETMASVKIISEDFDDYVHLAKVENAWCIVNVLWDYLKKG